MLFYWKIVAKSSWVSQDWEVCKQDENFVGRNLYCNFEESLKAPFPSTGKFTWCPSRIFTQILWKSETQSYYLKLEWNLPYYLKEILHWSKMVTRSSWNKVQIQSMIEKFKSNALEIWMIVTFENCGRQS